MPHSTVDVIPSLDLSASIDNVIRNSVGLFELGADPAVVVDTGFIYTKDDVGITELFYRASDGTVTQLTGTGGSGGGWTDDGTVVRLTTITDQVGIGTIAPTRKLEVTGNVRVNPLAEAPAPVAAGFILFGTVDPFVRSQIWHTGTDSVFRMGADTADGDAFDADSEGIVVYHPTGDQLGRIKADRFALTRASDSSLNYFRVDQASLFYRANPPGGTIHFFVDRTTGFVGVGTGVPTVTFDVAGNAQCSGVVRLANGSSALPSLAFTNSLTSGLFRQAADSIGIATSAVEQYRIDAVGNLTMRNDDDFTPATDDTGEVGTDALRWHRGRFKTVVTGDLELKNEKIGAHWILREGVDGLYATNEKTQEKFRIVLEKIV